MSNDNVINFPPKQLKPNEAYELKPTFANVLEVLTPAQVSLKNLNEAIAATDPKFQMEIRYVQERLQFLLQRYGEPAIYALMRANLQITIDKGN